MSIFQQFLITFEIYTKIIHTLNNVESFYVLQKFVKDGRDRFSSFHHIVFGFPEIKISINEERIFIISV